MASHESDLDKLTSMLSQCLGRLDAEAFKLQENDGQSDFDTGDRLDDETARLQELVDSLLVVEMGEDQADLNAIVARATADCLQEIAVPIVLRQSLTASQTIASASSSLVTVAVRRALGLAADRLAAGDELIVTTRVENEGLLFEIESRGSLPDTHATERAETLREFVDELGGICRVRCNEQDLFVVLELPQVMATDRSESQ